MNKSDVRLAKKKILKCLTEDFEHGTQKNHAIFDKKEGYAIFHGTDLEMIMEKVVLGLYLALADSEQENEQ